MQNLVVLFAFKQSIDYFLAVLVFSLIFHKVFLSKTLMIFRTEINPSLAIFVELVLFFLKFIDCFQQF